MQDLRQDSSSGFTTDPFVYLQALGGLLGAALMVVGMVFSIRLLNFFFGLLSNPESFQTYHEQMIQALGEDSLEMQFGDTTLNLTELLALIVFGVGILIMGKLLGMVLIHGAKMLHTCLKDRTQSAPSPRR